MSGPNQSLGQWLLSTLESDALAAGGAPLVALVQDLIAHKGNALAQQADWLKFIATAPAAGISFEVTLEGQLLQAVLGKLQAAIAAKVPAPAPAAPPAA